MNYKDLLEHSFDMTAKTLECPPSSRLEYLGEQIFGFTTYDGEMSALFARKAIEVCAAINNGSTFDYMQEESNYCWYLLLCNLPFVAERIEWGSSIRGAWWKPQVELRSFVLWIGDKQIDDAMRFSGEEWSIFIEAVIEFAAPEMEKMQAATVVAP